MVFDPGTASSSAAAFAGILAAIVLAVIGLLATPQHDPSAAPSHKLTLLVGFPLLVQLLSSAYMFVLLSGLSTVSPGGGPDPGALRVAAFDFAISGSTLAVAAVGALVFLRLVLLETGGDTNAGASVATSVIIAGSCVDAVFLVYGYGDIHNAFYGHPFPVGLWVLHGAILAAGILGGARWPAPERLPTDEIKGLKRISYLSVLFGSLVPVWAFLIANKATFNAELRYVGPGVTWVSIVSAIWAAVMFGVLVWVGRAEVVGIAEEEP